MITIFDCGETTLSRRGLLGAATLAGLAPLRERAVERFLTVPDPRRAILEATPETFRAVRIRVAP